MSNIFSSCQPKNIPKLYITGKNWLYLTVIMIFKEIINSVTIAGNSCTII